MALERLVAGITLAQLDELNHLVGMITAAGDVIAVSGPLMDERSLPRLGEIIYQATCQVRDLLDQVEQQPLADAAAPPMAGGRRRVRTQ